MNTFIIYISHSTLLISLSVSYQLSVFFPHFSTHKPSISFDPIQSVYHPSPSPPSIRPIPLFHMQLLDTMDSAEGIGEGGGRGGGTEGDITKRGDSATLYGGT